MWNLLDSFMSYFILYCQLTLRKLKQRLRKTTACLGMIYETDFEIRYLIHVIAYMEIYISHTQMAMID